MFPYFQYKVILFGSIPIQVWGLMVSAGIIAGALLGKRLSKKYGLAPALFFDLGLGVLLAAFIGARLVHVSLYQPAWYAAHPLAALKVWEGGFSSLGGFLGGALGVYFFAKRRRLTVNSFLPYADILSVSLWLGWGVGRLGCFFIHDHPGTRSHFLLAVNYPGGARHDLGLYESILGFALFILFFILFKKLVKQRRGLVAAYSWLLYAVVRFFLDFLRANDLPGSDVRYAALTPAQWGMLGLAFGIWYWLFYTRQRQPGALAP